jgi:hypothetical protein
MERSRGQGPRGFSGRSVPAPVGRARRALVDGGTTDRGTNAIARLTKINAERLLADYDGNPLAALTAALRIALDRPDATWTQLLAAAPIDASRRQRLHDADESSLDQLAAELNERRCLDEHRSHMPASHPEADGGSAKPTDIRPR